MSEKQYVLNMIEQFAKPGALFAMVADSYDIFNFCEMLGDDQEISDKIKAHGATGGFTIIRPDSGDPVVVLPKMLHILEKHFGAPKNDKGYKVLNNVRIIWGDGINALSIASILRCVVDLCGYSADCIAFGMGGALLGAPQRDDLSWAMKCSAIGIREYETIPVEGTADVFWKDGQGPNTGKLVWRDVYKDPVTDSGKKSKRGRVTLYESDGQYQSGLEGNIPTSWTDKSTPWVDALVTYFEDGEVKFTQTVDEVRANTKR